MQKQATNGHHGNAESKLAAIIEKAKSSGERQLLRLTMEPCSDPESKCDLDYIGTWVMPDGSMDTTRSHSD